MPDRTAPPLEDRYEKLRRRALGDADPWAEPAPSGAGYGLFVQRGMLAWMRTCMACAPHVEPARPALLTHSGVVPTQNGVVPTQDGAVLPPGVEAELIQVLTALILSRQQSILRQVDQAGRYSLQ
jgi:hypothetical protein